MGVPSHACDPDEADTTPSPTQRPASHRPPPPHRRYDQLAEGTKPWFMESTQVDCEVSPWELGSTAGSPFVAAELAKSFVGAVPALVCARKLLDHIAATEPAAVFKRLPTRKELPA